MQHTLPSFFAFFFSLIAFFGAGCVPITEKANAPAPLSTPVAASVSEPDTRSEPIVTTSSVNVQETPPMIPISLAFPGELSAQEVNKNIRIKTTKGDIVIRIDRDMGPKAASNFVYLVKQGFYNNTIFHRAIPGFMIQGGDPIGTGRGGPGYRFGNDVVSSAYADGVVAMANAGRDTNGSQFFIMVADYPLPPDYSQFGRVIQGLDVAHAIADAPRDPMDRPLEEVKMMSVTIE